MKDKLELTNRQLYRILVDRYIFHMSLTNVGKKFGVSHQTIGAKAREFEKKFLDYYRKQKEDDISDEVAYARLNMEFDCLGTSHMATILHILEAKEINPNHLTLFLKEGELEEMCRQHMMLHKTIALIAMEHGCSNTTISKTLKEFRMNVRATYQKIVERVPEELTEEEKDNYVKSEMSAAYPFLKEVVWERILNTEELKRGFSFQKLFPKSVKLNFYIKKK